LSKRLPDGMFVTLHLMLLIAPESRQESNS
jgi:hypothetical protein